jgi:hypothetical protein
MAIVFRECIAEEQRSVVRLLWQDNSMQRIHKEMFPLYGWKCLSRKMVHNWIEKFSQGRSNVEDDARQGAEVAGTTVKRVLCCGFRRIYKTMGQVYQCWCRICRQTNVFLRFEYRMFYVSYPFVTYVLTLLRIIRFTCNLIFRTFKSFKR